MLVSLEQASQVQALLEKHPDLEASEALLTAVSKDNLTLTSWLLEKNSHINYQRSEDQRTALYIAVCADNYEMTKVLLAHQANPDIQDGDGWTPLMDAVFHTNKPMIELLLSHKANISLRDKENKTALEMAKSANNQEIISLLNQYNNSLKRK
ncbi:ankyrin repeat domain-containing protein [Rhodocytophaga rosea]|uniref:Ankyrin repeat domain-containing protein n=1 Tax=Rhodocytophaga rosea TaxID=2704465 RepID=A0A6C0GBE4_9BACT|nr:ankyrin repeat domain-containing protein [Rhodocytophaga rosea]QHT65217.1 ankyrin repeat domain-containing protein [Rhodocytophaga rosea]